MKDVLAKNGAILVGDLPANDAQHLIIHLFFPQITKRLDQRAALASGRGHVPRNGSLQDDLLFANFYFASRAVGKKDDARWHLFGETEHVDGIGAGRLKANGIASHQRACNRIGGGCNGAEHRMLHRVIVKPPAEFTDDILLSEPPQRGFDCSRAAYPLKMPRCEYPTPTMPVDMATNQVINCLRLIGHLIVDGKSGLFSRQIKNE